MNYSQAIEFINNSFTSFQTAGKSAYKEGLEGITAMCQRLDNPQRDYLTIHIAGTNGKGSVAHTLASVLQSAGYCTGLYTSPHLHDFRERIRVDGKPIGERAVAKFVSDYGTKMNELELSYFEMTTAMAFRHFSDSNVEVAVIETGLGGRLDSTNIIRPILSIITNVALDHTDVLGETLKEIAGEKAGIIKRGVPIVIGESNPETDQVFNIRAAESRCKIFFADKFYTCIERERSDCWERYTLQRNSDGRIQSIDLDLKGDYQQRNIMTVRAAVHVLRHETPLSISTRALMTGCRTVAESTGLQGRWQVIAESPFTVVDAGHNAHALRIVADQLRNCKYDKLYMILGLSADKNTDDILSLLPRDAHYIFTQADSPRALTADSLARLAAAYELTGEVIPRIADALATARQKATPTDMIFIGGSCFVAGEAV
jgi:dihydrofolate synthase/folylpolyglutamate synthase